MAAAERAEQGQPVILLVSGEAGVGEIRLLSEVVNQALSVAFGQVGQDLFRCDRAVRPG
jgi:hypothetical protein